MKKGKRRSLHSDNARDADPSGWRRTFQALTNALPADYRERVAAMKHLRGAFQRELAAALQPSLRAFIEQEEALFRNGTPRLKSRRALAAHIGHDLHMLGLAVRDPLTSEPTTILHLQDRDRNDAHRTGGEDSTSTPVDGQQSPAIEVIDNPPRPRPLNAWLRARPSDGRSR